MLKLSELRDGFYDHNDEELLTKGGKLLDVQAACIPPVLRRYVDTLMVNRPRREASAFSFSRAPECVVHVVFNVYRCTSTGQVESGELMVSGVHAGDHPMPLDVRETIVAQLWPGAARAILGIPASSIVGQFLRLDELWGAEAREATERIASQITMEERVRAFSEVLCARVANREHDTFVMRAAEALGRTAAGPHPRTPADLFGYSERHVLRRFREDLGMSPKEFVRIIRLAAVWKDPSAGWARNAALHGYYDQAHLIRDCRALLGDTPARFLHGIAVPELMRVGVIVRRKPFPQQSGANATVGRQ
jgi:AraC-like DNA-binding protein